MELGSFRWCSTVLSWSLSLQSSHWCFGVGRRHFSHWIFLCGLHRFGCGQSLAWGRLPLQREADLLVRSVRIVMRSRKGRKTCNDQPGEKRCLVISPGGISLWTCFGCRWTFGTAQPWFLLSLLYLWPHLLTYYELYRGRKLLSNSQSYGFLF